MRVITPSGKISTGSLAKLSVGTVAAAVELKRLMERI